MSPALRVALSIAAIWDGEEAGLVFQQAASSWTEMFCGSSVCEDGVLVRLIFVDRRP